MTSRTAVVKGHPPQIVLSPTKLMKKITVMSMGVSMVLLRKRSKKNLVIDHVRLLKGGDQNLAPVQEQGLGQGHDRANLLLMITEDGLEGLHQLKEIMLYQATLPNEVQVLPMGHPHPRERQEKENHH